jgi:hypothetical protein
LRGYSFTSNLINEITSFISPINEKESKKKVVKKYVQDVERRFNDQLFATGILTNDLSSLLSGVSSATKSPTTTITNGNNTVKRSSQLFNSIRSPFQSFRKRRSTSVGSEDREYSFNSTNNSLEFGWNWIEIVKLFELFLLTTSSIHPRFSPTSDAQFLAINKKYLYENKNLFKVSLILFFYSKKPK